MSFNKTIGIGTVLGEFEIESVLGKGGMGVVYKAHEPSLNRKVALKVLSHMLSADKEFITRFKKEAQIIAALKHPNIVSILSFGQDLDHYYFAMEYIKGGDLAQILKEKKIIPLEEALSIARQVADALSEAGKKGVVHRDLKPANIMIDDMNSVRVTDFGVARLESSNDNLTKTGMFLGSPQYASPEQAEGLPIDTRSDIYALGAVLYRMLAGTPPTTGNSPLAVVVKIVSETVTPIEEVNKTVPKPVCDLISKMMAKDLKLRYQTPEKVVEAIDNCLHLLKTGENSKLAGTIKHPPPPGASGPRNRNYQLRPWLAGTIGVLVLILLFAGGSFLISKKSTGPPVSATTSSQPETPTQTGPPAAAPVISTPEQPQVTSVVAKIESPPEPPVTTKNPATNISDQKEAALAPLPATNETLPTKTLVTRVSPAATLPVESVVNTDNSIQTNFQVDREKKALPESPTVLLIVSGPDEMTLPLQAHLESRLLDSSLQVIAPAEIPILYKKMQIGDMPVNWYNIRQFTANETAHILVLAKIHKAGSTILRFYGTSQEQISAVFSVRTMDMSTGKLVDRSITGMIKYTALNMQDEFQDALSTTVDKLDKSILEYWRRKKADKNNTTPAEPIKNEQNSKLKV